VSYEPVKLFLKDGNEFTLEAMRAHLGKGIGLMIDGVTARIVCDGLILMDDGDLLDCTGAHDKMYKIRVA
jgi:hypothetical protein